jgi:hypothetical protein
VQVKQIRAGTKKVGRDASAVRAAVDDWALRKSFLVESGKNTGNFASALGELLNSAENPQIRSISRELSGNFQESAANPQQLWT